MSFCNLKCFLFNLHRIWDRFDGTKPGNYFTDRKLIKQAINIMNEELAGCIRFSLKDKEYTGGKHVRVFRNWKQEATANGCYATIGNAPVNSESHLYNQFDYYSVSDIFCFSADRTVLNTTQKSLALALFDTIRVGRDRTN